MTRSGVLATVVAAAAGVLGILLSYPELLGFAAGSVVLLVLCAGWVWFAPDLACRRSVVPGRAFEGAEAISRLTLTNRRRSRSLPAVGYESVADRRQRLAIPGLASGASITLELPLPTGVRGRHVIPPMLVHGSDPFGMFGFRRWAGSESLLWVYPRPDLAVPLADDARRELDAAAARALPGGSTFDGLRDYLPEDDSRLIHWPSYARSGDLLVRTHVVAEESRHLVVLDTGDVYGDPQAFEAAVRVVASWCAAGLETGTSVMFATTDGRVVRAQAKDGEDGPRQLWEALAVVGPRPGASAAELVGTLLHDDPPTALGWVTGHLGPDLTDTVAGLGRGLAAASLATVGSVLPTRVRVDGAFVGISARTNLDWVAAWNDAFRGRR